MFVWILNTLLLNITVYLFIVDDNDTNTMLVDVHLVFLMLTFKHIERNIQLVNEAQKAKFSLKNFFSKCKQIRFLEIWSHLMKKSLMDNIISSAFSFLILKM